MWIDPEKDLFTVVLTNRVHPDGTGDSKPLVARINTTGGADDRARGGSRGQRAPNGPTRCARASTYSARSTSSASEARTWGSSPTRPAGPATARRASTCFANAPDADARRSVRAGARPRRGPGGQDRETASTSGPALPVYSLYGEAFAPSAESLAGIDTLVFDIQDVGTRFYTYASTMRRAMQAARDHDLRFVVLDRPNPIDGTDVAGPVLVPSARSFVNYHALPVRHGMTVGELACLFDADDHLGVALSVVPMRGWRRAFVRRRDGAALGEPFAQPAQCRRGSALPGARAARGDQPVRRAWHRRAVRESWARRGSTGTRSPASWRRRRCPGSSSRPRLHAVR